MSVKLAYVIPFRGLRYNREIVPNMAQVASPPYDIISAAEQNHYHQKNEYNSISLDFGLDEAEGSGDRYQRADATLKKWISEEVLLPESSPALYVLREEFTGPDGRPAVREGFFAAVRLSEFSEGIILPHEETAPGPKADRLKLMEATEANLSPIFCLYSDPENRIRTALQDAQPDKPDATFTDEAGTRQSLWVVDDPEATSLVSEILADKKLLIADGHHRYETALYYRNSRRQQADDSGTGGGDQPYDYLMVYLSNMSSSTGSVLPIHRVVCGLQAETVAGIFSLLERDFVLEEITPEEGDRAEAMTRRLTEAGRDQNAFGMYLPASDSFHVLVARRPRPLLDAAKTGHSEAWRSLEVSVLDQLVLKDLMGIVPGGPNDGAQVTFVERTENALRRAKGCDVAFFVNATTMEEIKAVAEAGEKMPQKSTYFHPKPLTGLVFRSFKY